MIPVRRCGLPQICVRSHSLRLRQPAAACGCESPRDPRGAPLCGCVKAARKRHALLEAKRVRTLGEKRTILCCPVRTLTTRQQRTRRCCARRQSLRHMPPPDAKSARFESARSMEVGLRSSCRCERPRCSQEKLLWAFLFWTSPTASAEVRMGKHSTTVPDWCAGQFFLYDAFKEGFSVTGSDLTVFYDVLGKALSPDADVFRGS
eukprot:4597533-Pleurochrysis_carterae.AAC.3